jgi:two-component system response regulator NreC
MDITMPGMDGLAATKDIRRSCPGAKVLALTMHDDAEYLRQMLRAGASGYVVKRAADVELTTAIRAIHRGEVFLYPSVASVARAVVEDYLDGPTPARETDDLTDREREVLRLIAQGHTNREAADRLCISVKTVETHRAHLMEKLGIKSRAGLTRYAIQKGLLDQEG